MATATPSSIAKGVQEGVGKLARSVRDRVAHTAPGADPGDWLAVTVLTDRETVVALVPAGYADGIPRAAGNAGPVRVGDVRTRIAGRVCMDQVVVDLGPGSDARPGDVADR